MPFEITKSTLSDINPTNVGGIINANGCELNFKYNFVSNIISSTSASCFYLTNSNVSVKNSCFMRCSAGGGDGKYGNVGDIQTSKVKLKEISSFLCSFSYSKSGDSVFRFLTCDVSTSNYNSSFCHSIGGAASFRFESGTCDIDFSYVTCSSGIAYAFIECNNIADYNKCAFVNSTEVTLALLVIKEGSILNNCYFIQMTTKNKFYTTVTLNNCYADENINGYTLNVFTDNSEVLLPSVKNPKCKGKIICTIKRAIRKQPVLLHLIILLINRY